MERCSTRKHEDSNRRSFVALHPTNKEPFVGCKSAPQDDSAVEVAAGLFSRQILRLCLAEKHAKLRSGCVAGYLGVSLSE